MLVLADEPMHGYQIMQAINDRTSGVWRLSPGAVYPTIAQLADEGLVTTEKEGGRRLVTITPRGRTYLQERSARLGDPFADFAGRGTWARSPGADACRRGRGAPDHRRWRPGPGRGRRTGARPGAAIALPHPRRRYRRLGWLGPKRR